VTTYNEAYQEALDYYSGDELSAKTFVDKYALRDAEGNFKETTPPQMQERTSKELHRIEATYPNPRSYEEIFEAQKDFKYFSLQGSGMFGVGNPYSTVSLSNCFVIDSPKDDLSSIMEQGKAMANIYARRGGVGIDISTLRPEGTAVSNAAKTTSGAWSFADLYSYVCRMIGQNGRRGALMVSMDVRHPDIFKFAKMKRDKSKVTGANVSIKLSNEFMEAVKEDSDFTLQWPVDSTEPSIVRVIKARELWDTIITSAHGFAEPGLLFWDTMLDNLPAQCYKDAGFNHLSTNPCLSGDTLVAVADGRNAVSIKQLAEEGRDVPVYSANKETGKTEIKLGRNPRVTGTDKELWRLTLDDGTTIDATPDHRFNTIDLQKVPLKDLTPGTSLLPFNSNRDAGYRHIEGAVTRGTSYGTMSGRQYRLMYQHYKGKQPQGTHIHHVDFDSTNDLIENLRLMDSAAHRELHAARMRGDKNPYHRMSDEWKGKFSTSSGEENGKYSGFTNEDLKNHALKLTKSLDRRYSTGEWSEYATSIGLPKAFSEFRTSELGDVNRLAMWAATEIGVEHLNEDPRVVKTLALMLDQGYNARIKRSTVFVDKTCESCKNIFEVDQGHRESSYCSSRCISDYINKDEAIYKRRHESRQKFLDAQKEETSQNQARIYSAIKFKLGRSPLMKEWKVSCKEEGVPFRVGKHSFYKTYKEVKEAGENYNHKVASVEKLEGLHTVYNVTVDDNHNFFVITSGDEGFVTSSGISTWNCGELILPAEDSCRLMAMILVGFVSNPFKTNASFDFKLFKDKVRLAQRMMDNLVDLEIECIKKIIKKVDTKSAKDLWKKINDMGMRGRRTGLGYTGLADTLAQMGIRYDSEEALEMASKIDKILCHSSYEESINLAEERGAFPVFDWDLEKNNAFIKRLPKKLRDRASEVGRRNISLLTNAPTGSLSIVAGNISSGIEPVFKNSYIRRKKINPSDESPKVDFIDDLGDKWQEFSIFHKNVERWAKQNVPDWDGTSMVELPDFFVTAEEIDWEKRVELQGLITSYRDHSVSSTINLPSTATKEEVSEIYMKSWEKGLKGVTVYVDGCRSGVLVSNEEKDSNGRPKNINTTQAPRRPDLLPCEVYHGLVQGELWSIVVGLMAGKPYELFGGPAHEAGIPKSVTSGYLEKIKASKNVNKYNLIFNHYNTETKVEDLSSLFENKVHGTLTRMLSLSLRHGAPVQHIVEQLAKDVSDDLFSLSSVLRRALKKHIIDGTKVSKTSASCDQCGSSELKYQEGCPVCLSCGFTKCS
jgi:ribonucleotide reductase alpha subunit